MNWVIFACYFYACAGISSKTTVLWLLLSLSSLPLSCTQSAQLLSQQKRQQLRLITKDGRRRLRHRLSLSLSPSSFVTFHVSFYEWRQRRRSCRKQTTKKHKAHFYICKIYERRDECGARNETKSSKIHKNQMTKIKSAFTLLSLSLFLYRSVRLVLHLRLAACALRHDTTTVNFIHSWFMNRRRVVFTFFRLCFCCCCWEFQTTSSSNKVPKNFTIVFSVTLYLHTQLIYACFLLFLFIICDVFFYCVMRVCVCVCYLIWHNPQ